MDDDIPYQMHGRLPTKHHKLQSELLCGVWTNLHVLTSQVCRI